MIAGSVTHDGKEAVIEIDVRGPSGRTSHLQGVVDTGFTHHLTLPHHEIEGLQLRWIGDADVTTADGQTTKTDLYAGMIRWDSETLSILIAEAETKPLIGMSLMKDYRLTIDVVPNGTLALSKLESTTEICNRTNHQC